MVLTAKDSCKCIDNNAEDRLGHLFPLFKKYGLICRFTKNLNSKRQYAKSLRRKKLVYVDGESVFCHSLQADEVSCGKKSL